MDRQGFLVVGGRRSWFHADKAGSPTATGIRTSSGMIVGQVVQPFSGAYSGERSWTFIKVGRKVYISDDSKPFKTVKGAVCIAPKPMSQPLFQENGEAKVFQHGKFQSVGLAHRITNFDGTRVDGCYLVDKLGKSTFFVVTDSVEGNVYAQWFSWSKGKRKLGEKIPLTSKDVNPVWP